MYSPNKVLNYLKVERGEGSGTEKGRGEVSGWKRGGWDLGRGEYIELVVVVYIYAYERVVESNHGAYIHATLT